MIGSENNIVIHDSEWTDYSSSGLINRLVKSGSPASDIDIITSDYRVHKSLLTSSSVAKVDAHMFCYVRIGASSALKSFNSGMSVMALADEHYTRATRQLEDIRGVLDEDGDPIVEDAAIDTAELILNQLQVANYAPPELSWHGGDAVVMLWSAQDMTYAITVTDGEWGYVARRGEQQVRLLDSLKVDRYLLKDMR